MDFKNIQLNRPEGVAQEVINTELTEADVAKVTEIIEGMSRAEKVVAVRSIATEILQNEVTRRIKRDKAKLNDFRELVNSMEKY